MSLCKAQLTWKLGNFSSDSNFGTRFFLYKQMKQFPRSELPQTGPCEYTCMLANTLCKPVSKNTHPLWALARAVQANKFAHNQKWGGIFSEFTWVHHSCLLQPDSRLNLTWVRCQAWDMPGFSEVLWAVVNFPASLKACSDMCRQDGFSLFWYPQQNYCGGASSWEDY